MSTLVIREVEKTKKVELKINHEKDIKSIEIHRAVNGSNYEKMYILGSAVFPLKFPVKTYPLGGVVSAE